MYMAGLCWREGGSMRGVKGAGLRIIRSRQEGAVVIQTIGELSSDPGSRRVYQYVCLKNVTRDN
jgi:hypothetical protein